MIDDLDRRAVLLGSGLILSSGASAGPANAQQQAPTSGDVFIAQAKRGPDAAIALNAAFDALSNSRTNPPKLKGWGVGAITVPRGLWKHGAKVVFSGSQVGFSLRGETAYATTHLFNISAGSAFSFKTYVWVTLSDFYLRNDAPDPGDSVGIILDPEGGGGPLTVKRVAIDGFATAIKVTGAVNGDKTLVEQVAFGTAVGFDNGIDKQAVGWTFANCSGICPTAHFRLGGAGEVGIAGYVGNVLGSFLQFPESSGNAGASNFPARITVAGTQLEYHGDGPRMLIDARQSLLHTEGGGSNVDIVLRELSIVSGSTPPDPRKHVIIQVGDERSGSDAVRVKQEGGWIEGVVRHGSAQQGAFNRRWSFRDALRAPDPQTVELQGTGSHPLMEWRANENVAVDQYRGGQAFVGAIDAQKAFLWRHVGPMLLNSGVGSKAIGGRHGGDFAVGGFPPGTTQVGLAVFLDEALPEGCDLLVAQFSDAAFRVPVGPSLALPAGTRKGLRRVHDQWHVLDDGALFVRITLPAPQRAVRGALVPFYFPYMGS